MAVLNMKLEDSFINQLNTFRMSPTDEEILQEIREICKGLALSDRARAARYDKIVEVLNGRN